MFNYVHKNGDPTKILMYGYSDFTGQFDVNLFTQVSCAGEHEMPEGWTEYTTPSIREQLHTLLETKVYEEKKEILKLIGSIIESTSSNNSGVAQDIVTDSTTLTQQTKNEIISIITGS